LFFNTIINKRAGQNFSLKLKILKVLTFSSEGGSLPAGRQAPLAETFEF
jgi:hypothetical protein